VGNILGGRNSRLLPLPPGPLEHVNVYLIEGGRDCLLVDAGWDTPEAFSVLEEQLKENGFNFGDINQIVITHIHADHYGIRNEKELEAAKVEIPTFFEAGMTSIAIDASHLPDDKNLLANIAINPFIPKWAGLETEVGEIKGEGFGLRS
jgi:glyoxylase-like metal-dependent hydrolase (beta-lactamase superfamily II)